MATATERLLAEVKSGDVPVIRTGNFKWQPVDKQLLDRQAGGNVPPAAGNDNQKPIGGPNQGSGGLSDLFDAPQLTKKAFPLNLLENKTFAGKGYNTIWRPRSFKPFDPAPPGEGKDVLELNLTAETTSFTKSLGDVPNRGVDAQDDIMLNGLAYVQRVGAFETLDDGIDKNGEPTGIHFEPGCFMFVPGSKIPRQGATINRMGSIPHGTTINAQGLAPTAMKPGAPTEKDIKSVSITPFQIGFPNSTNRFGMQDLGPEGGLDDRLPKDLSVFKSKKLIDQKILDNPNEVLLRAIKDQEIEAFTTFELTTDPPKEKTYFGGGTANIGFLGGNSLTTAGRAGDENAHAVTMTCRYWIETVTKKITIQAKQSKPQEFQIVSTTGIPGPTFVAPPTDKLTQDKRMTVKWTQIQYSQNVSLNFNTLTWPHVSVATLGDVSRYNLDLSKDTFGPA